MEKLKSSKFGNFVFSIGLIGAVVLMFYYLSRPDSPPLPINQAPAAKAESPEKLAEKAVTERRFQKTLIFLSSLKKSMREPDSVVWNEILTDQEAKVICVEYKGKNGFGGISKEFAVYAEKKVTQNISLWNKHCTGKSLYDMKFARYGLK